MHPKAAGELPAAQYVRKSTDRQTYSIEFQKQAIAEYAASHGFTVVESYVDAGRSGLTIEGRPELARLIKDVVSGSALFKAVLVYDVSRWGRFQNVDESAYHEYACKRAGVSVHYCAEQFDNDSTPVSTIIKTLKRVMAAEYSRELGVKVFNGQKIVVRSGFRLGSLPGYGFRRMLVDGAGNSKQLLKSGERKSVTTDRIMLVPGPKKEIEVVHWIFDQVIRHRKYETAIARELNRRGVSNGVGTPWSAHVVRGVLRNPKYIGQNIWNRTSQKLERRTHANPPSDWVCSPMPFQPIVPTHIFAKAQEILAERARRATDEDVLKRLQELLTEKGVLSANLIDSTKKLPATSTIMHRFGSLKEVYRRLGYDPAARDELLRDLHLAITKKARAALERRGAKVRVKAGERYSFLVDDRVTLHTIMLRCRGTGSGPRWRLWAKQLTAQGYVLAIRMGLRIETPEAIYLFPPGVIHTLSQLDFGEENLRLLLSYRLPSLNALPARIAPGDEDSGRLRRVSAGA